MFRSRPSVTISGSSTGKLEAALLDVFYKHGYVIFRSEADDFIFEKKGSFLNATLYDDWSEGGVWARIKVHVRTLQPGQIRVDCEPYMVRERGNPLFEKEQRQIALQHGQYQKLLDELARSLKGK